MPRDFQSSPVRVVIVDDHRLFVDALALLLGHDERLTVIGTAGDGRSAIELAVSKQAEVAVIDVRMPEIDGLECARRLRVQSPGTRVILVTGLDEPTLADQAKEAGAVALLTKGALHVLAGFWPQPIQWIGVALGVLCTLVATGLGVYAVVFWIDRANFPGPLFGGVAILFVLGVNGFILALVGEYLGRIRRDVSGRPLYTVEREL
jgi:CheY-like chemotaxis protein